MKAAKIDMAMESLNLYMKYQRSVRNRVMVNDRYVHFITTVVANEKL